MRFQAKGQNRNAYEKNGNDLNRARPVRRPRFVEQRPNFRFKFLPTAEAPIVIIVFPSKSFRNFFVRRLGRVDVQTFDHRQSLLGLAMLSVGHPTAGLNLVCVQAPVLEFFFEQRPANVRWVMEFSCSKIFLN